MRRDSDPLDHSAKVVDGDQPSPVLASLDPGGILRRMRGQVEATGVTVIVGIGYNEFAYPDDVRP